MAFQGLAGGNDRPRRPRGGHNPAQIRMNRGISLIKAAMFCLAVLLLPSCSSAHIGDMPHWMGGLPADAPPRPGTLEYDAWMAKRAEEAARPKTEQQQPK
jgi:hypothetical protein